MNIKYYLSALTFIFLIFNSSAQSDFKKDWLEVDSLEKKGLYRMALKEVDLIFDKATKNKSHNQVIKSVFYELKYNSYLEEDDYILGIYRLEKLIDKSPSPSKEILHSLTAEVYWGYYNANSWKFAERTSVASDLKLDDVRTWDLKRIAKKVIYHYKKSLDNSTISQNEKIDAFENIISGFNDTEDFRPTLFDFLGHRAITFFSANSFNVPGPAETYTIHHKDYFTSNTSFLNLNVSTNDSLNTKYYATMGYKILTDFHLRDKNKSSLLMLEIDRIKYVNQNSTAPNKEQLYYEALSRLTKVYTNNKYIAEVWYLIAQTHSVKGNNYNYPSEENRWEKKKALEICEQVQAEYPSSYGAQQCAALVSQIKEKSFSFNSEIAIVPKQKSRILLNYKNFTKLYLKIISYPINKYERNHNNQKEYIKSAEGVFEKEIDLIDPKDYQNHSIEYLMPELTNGHYVIVASTSPKFEEKSNAFAYQSFWVTNLTYQTQHTKNEGKVLVTSRTSGSPIEDAIVTVNYSKYNYTTRINETKTYGKYKTDKNGLITFNGNTKNRSYFFTVEKDNDMYQTNHNVYLNNYPENPPNTNIQTHFFTDRKIYRPGQTIYFKGISYTSTGQKRALKSNWLSTVTFYDVNYQKITDVKVTTNEFGSFQGQFTAPFGVLTGSMTINNGKGSTSIRVEEYKRPKFTTEIEPLEGEFKLNDSITVTGEAVAYAGNKIDGAEVSYRITRTTRYNYWRWNWYWGGNYSTEKEIVFGKTMSDENGKYNIVFKAIPDETKGPKTLPIFDYTIYADVTDINGETHSTVSSVSVGYQSLVLGNNLPAEFTNKDERTLRVSTNNLNGQPIFAKGNVKIYPLIQPKRTFNERLWAQPDMEAWSKPEFEKLFPNEEYKNENDFHTWEKGNIVLSKNFNTKITDSISLKNIKKWNTGKYVYESIAIDKNGLEIKDVNYFTIFNDDDKAPNTNDVFKVKGLKTNIQPGKKAKYLIATAEKDLNVFYTIEHKGIITHQEWIKLSNEQKIIEIDIEEKHRGNFSVNFSVMKNNRSFTNSLTVYVPYKNKQLDIAFSTFRNKLLPGQDEEWILTIKNSKGEKEMAEMLATLYDASLDELYTPNSFYMSIYQSYYGANKWSTHNGMGQHSANNNNYYWNKRAHHPNRSYAYLNSFGYNTYYYGRRYGNSYGNGSDDGFLYDMEVEESEDSDRIVREVNGGSSRGERKNKVAYANEAPILDITTMSKEKQESNNRNDRGGDGKSKLGEIKARSNFNETAFFYPQLLTDEDGNIKVKFTIPESLTKWRFLGLAHTKDLKFGTIQEEIVTQKDLMVVPNAPRFFREGDKIILSTKISNISKEDLNGKVLLQLFDPFTEKPLDVKFKLTEAEQSFEAKSGRSTSVSWELDIPYEISAVKYKIVAAAGNFSDGEENVVPILTNRMLVTESMPMPVRGAEEKTFNFEKLQTSGNSNTLRHHRYTLEFTSNPAWYAVQAMPYMMEYPYECAEQTFTRYYSNAIASHIMNSSPKIKQVIEDWGKDSPEAFLSNLQKNQELKALLLEETPWVLDAKSEEQSKKNLSILLDMNRMSKELDKALGKTIKTQSANGGWPWFPGMKENRYITQHIITGLGHLDHLGIKDVRENHKTWAMVKKGIKYLDGEIVRDYKYAKKWDKDYLKNQHLGYSQIQYLYARSYFIKVGMDKTTQEAVNYYKNQAEKYWLNFNIYAEGMLALGAHRMEMNDLANDIVKSLKDRAIQHEEFGMYWKDYKAGFYWYQAPIETQAVMIEMFDEVANDQESVENLKIWLLKQKQTTNWKTTKQTTEAVYALLLNGTDLLASDDLVEVTVGGKEIEYTDKKSENPYKVNVQAGTGYFKTAWDGKKVKPEMGGVTVKKNTTGVAWGAMYWQYFEDLDKITYAETPLKLNKQLYLLKHSKEGEILTEITKDNVLKVGDKIRVRIELRTDRNLEYVHMKDMRASGFEPINVLSSYKYREGLGYYEATKDAATNFFFDYIPKGTYVFEYDLRVQHKGDFSNGITTIQCMYAPEFTSHSEGIRVTVK
jgi:hypothetical protein